MAMLYDIVLSYWRSLSFGGKSSIPGGNLILESLCDSPSSYQLHSDIPLKLAKMF